MTEKDPADKSFAEKRHDQLTTAPKADEADAAPRVSVDESGEGATRIDIADTAAVRPGKPDSKLPR